MEWINAGAKYDRTGERVPTKAALKRALRDAPQSIRIDTTGQFPAPEFSVIASELGNRPRIANESWQVCGPDPYKDRKWYATVTVNRLGNLKVT